MVSKTVILCHGLTGDKIGPTKLLSDLSKHIAIFCHAETIRFDFRGSGLSSGDFIDTSFESMCEDALFAATCSRFPVVWMGISTGALIALMAAAKREKKERVISISNGFADAPNFSDLENDLVPLRGGQLFLPKEYFIKRSSLCPRKEFFPHVGQVTAFLGSNDEKHFGEFKALQNAGAKVYAIENGDHLFTLPGTRNQLFEYIEKELL